MLRTQVFPWFVATAIVLGLGDTAAEVQVFNWGGEWISAPDQVLIATNTALRNYGLQEVVGELKQLKAYSITIDQTDDYLVVKFPRNVANPLNGVRFPASGGRTDILNFGEHWEKQIFTSRMVGSSLELAVTKSNGKWTEIKPEAATPAPTDFTLRLTLHRGKTPVEMLLSVAVSDRTGELGYLQLFQRVSETVTMAAPPVTASLALVSITPQVHARIGLDDRISAELSYTVEPFSPDRFFVSAVAQTTMADRTMQLRDSEVKLVTANGRVRVMFPVSAAFESPDVAQPLRFKFSLHQRVGELGMSQSIAATDLIEYRGK